MRRAQHLLIAALLGGSLLLALADEPARYIHGLYNPTRLHPALGYLSPNDYARTLKQAA